MFFCFTAARRLRVRRYPNMLQTCHKLLVKKVPLSGGLDSIITQGTVCVQPARGIRPRKPPHLPIAKTKLFKIPPRPQLPDTEKLELMRLTRNYKTLYKSITQFFQDENARHAEGSKLAEEEIVAEQQEWERCLELNKTWNAEVASVREDRLAAERKKREEDVLQAITEQEERRRKIKEEVEAVVRREKELSASYITPDNIDEAIKFAMENPVDFNFAIDIRGNINKGRFTTPSSKTLASQGVETVSDDSDPSPSPGSGLGTGDLPPVVPPQQSVPSQQTT